MEEYLQHMKTLRSHMNDVEDQAAKVSVEEQMQITTVHTLEKEIDLAKSETKRLKEDSDLMMKTKGQLCSQILEIQKKIASLENDSCTLSQTLELIQQERVNLSTKLAEKSTSYGKTEEELNTKLKEQEDWLHSHKSSSKSGHHSLVNAQIDRMDVEYPGNHGAESLVTTGKLDDAYKTTMTKLDEAKAKFEKLTQMRSELASERHKVKESLEKMKCRMDNFKPELRELASETLEEELQNIMNYKSEETEYQESLQNQFDAIKGVSHTIICGCGEEYKVEVDL